MDRKRRISRVDVQVSIVTAVLVTTPLICVYFFNYFITHEDMINSLKERSHSIYQYVDDYVDNIKRDRSFLKGDGDFLENPRPREKVEGRMTWKKDYLHPSPLQKDIRIKCATRFQTRFLMH